MWKQIARERMVQEQITQEQEVQERNVHKEFAYKRTAQKYPKLSIRRSRWLFSTRSLRAVLIRGSRQIGQAHTIACSKDMAGTRRYLNRKSWLGCIPFAST